MCNATDNTIWNHIFANDSSVSMLLSSAYSNTRQRVIFPDLVPSRLSPHSEPKRVERLSATPPLHQGADALLSRHPPAADADNAARRRRRPDAPAQRIVGRDSVRGAAPDDERRRQRHRRVRAAVGASGRADRRIPRVVRLGSSSVYAVDHEMGRYRDVAVRVAWGNDERSD